MPNLEVQKAKKPSLMQTETDEMTRLSQIPILDGEEWSLMEAMDLSIDAAQSDGEHTES
jgi:hypothetical protein